MISRSDFLILRVLYENYMKLRGTVGITQCSWVPESIYLRASWLLLSVSWRLSQCAGSADDQGVWLWAWTQSELKWQHRYKLFHLKLREPKFSCATGWHIFIGIQKNVMKYLRWSSGLNTSEYDHEISSFQIEMEKSGFRIEKRRRNGCTIKLKVFVCFAFSSLGMHKKSPYKNCLREMLCIKIKIIKVMRPAFHSHCEQCWYLVRISASKTKQNKKTVPYTRLKKKEGFKMKSWQKDWSLKSKQEFQFQRR